MMFPLVAYLNQGNMTDVQGGAGLIFQTLPGVFESFGNNTDPDAVNYLGIIIGSFFFLLLSFAALTSTVSLLEVPVAFLVDEEGIRRNRAVWVAAIIIFMIGIPSLLSNGDSVFLSNFVTYIGAEKATSFMDFVEHIASDTFLPLGGCLIVVFAAYVWKKENLSKEIESGNPGYKGSFWQKYINFSVSFVAPVILSIIFILTVLSRFFGLSVF